MSVVALTLAIFTLSAYGFRVRQGNRLFLGYTAGVLLLGCFSAILFDAVLFNTLRVAFPFFVFFFGAWVGSIAAEDDRVTAKLILHCEIASLISMVFRYIYATRIMGVDMEDMRYQLLSPALPFVLAFTIARFLYGRGFQFLALLSAVLAVSTIVLSVTRAFIITAAMAGVSWVFLVGWSRWKSVLIPKLDLWRVIGGVAGLVTAGVGMFLAYVFRPEIFNSWSIRLFSARSDIDGQDITYIVRVAEAQGIWDAVKTSPLSILIGKGFGNFYDWSGEYAEYIRRISVGMLDEFGGRWFAAHSVFTYGLFFGGVFGLIWGCYLFLLPLYRLLSQARVPQGNTSGPFVASFVTVYLTIFLYLSQSLTSNPFGERLSGLYLGVVVGLAITMGNPRPLGRPGPAPMRKIS